MVELLIIACLLKQPQRCEAFRVPFMEPTSIVQCLWQSTVHAAEWTAQHPGWVIRKVRCEAPQA